MATNCFITETRAIEWCRDNPTRRTNKGYPGDKPNKRQDNHPQSDGAGNTRYQTTRAPQEDMAPTDEGRHGGRGCYPGCGPRPEGVEKEDKADPYEIGKRPPR